MKKKNYESIPGTQYQTDN
jgi:hypothetical protein